jgi:hypothetical protein
MLVPNFLEDESDEQSRGPWDGVLRPNVLANQKVEQPRCLCQVGLLK